jgi:hypothetical protein
VLLGVHLDGLVVLESAVPALLLGDVVAVLDGTVVFVVLELGEGDGLLALAADRVGVVLFDEAVLPFACAPIPFVVADLFGEADCVRRLGFLHASIEAIFAAMGLEELQEGFRNGSE